MVKSSLASSAVRIATAVLVIAPLALAVDNNNWRTFAPPVGATTAISNTGTTTSYLTATHAHFYSGITKQWRSVAIASPGFYEHYNAYAVVVDGTQIHAFCSRTGEIATITTSGNATLVSGPASSSWVTIVIDGTQAWGFSGFRGAWQPLTLSQPNATAVAQRVTGLIKDGTTVYGFSAYHGTFVPVAADAQATIQVASGGEVGAAHSPGILRGFSANQNAWGVMAFNAVQGTVLKEGAILAFSDDTAVGFSGLTGTFATETLTAQYTGGLQADAMVGVFTDGADTVCYGAGQGAFARLQNVTTPSYVTDYHFAMVIEPGKVTPFSAMMSQFGAPITGSHSISTNDAMAYAAPVSGAGYAYSPLLNTWTQAPATPTPFASVVTRSGALLVHANGYEAISARYGTWVSLPTTAVGSYQAPTNSSAMLVFEGSDTAHVFDTRINRWNTLHGNGPLTATVFRHSVLAHDGVNGYGYGIPSSRWDTVSLNGLPVSVFDLSSSTGIIETAQDFHIYCVTGDLSYEGREPEFSRSMKLGNVMRMHQVAPAGSALISLIGLTPAYLDLGPDTGILFIDPGTIFAVNLPVLMPSNGLLHIDVHLPEDPALIGLQPHLQNIVFPPAGQPYLTTSVTPFLY
jgi:hypothetical protein